VLACRLAEQHQGYSAEAAIPRLRPVPAERCPSRNEGYRRLKDMMQQCVLWEA